LERSFWGTPRFGLGSFILGIFILGMCLSVSKKESARLLGFAPAAFASPPCSRSAALGAARRSFLVLRCLGFAVSSRLVSRFVARSEFAARRSALRSSLDLRFGSLFRVEHSSLETRVYTDSDTLVFVYYRHDLDSSIRIVD